ncbi:MAG TPA: alpha-ribazole phosphatase family protein [Puia sp.]|nr:alpha-ribazole phosphatase family protein [Puia sp.]
MKEIYLIRHTTPAVAKGICYGQTDLDITESFNEEAAIIRQHLPEGIVAVHSSPLQRCHRLASHLFPGFPIALHNELMEIHCGQWEMKGWDELPKEEVDPWMKDFVQIRIPGGESYLDLHQRVTRCYEAIRGGSTVQAGQSAVAGLPPEKGSTNVTGQVPENAGPLAIVAHGGVIRSILSYITDTPLIDSFKVFALHYGCVIRLFGEEGPLQYEILSNLPPQEKEQHKPKSFY